MKKHLLLIGIVLFLDITVKAQQKTTVKFFTAFERTLITYQVCTNFEPDKNIKLYERDELILEFSGDSLTLIESDKPYNNIKLKFAKGSLNCFIVKKSENSFQFTECSENVYKLTQLSFEVRKTTTLKYK